MVQLSPQQCEALLSSLRLSVFGITLTDVLRDPKFEPDDRELDMAEIFHHCSDFSPGCSGSDAAS
jgi:hypothetical protein